MNRGWLESVFEWRAVRWVAGLAFLCRGYLRWLSGARYRAMEDFCWVSRVVRLEPLLGVADRMIADVLQEARRSGRNPIVGWYRESSASHRLADVYALSGPSSADLWRDVIVLKSATDAEKGVILLKYTRTFSAMVALFDLDTLMQRYTFVLEPCWAGYCDPAILMFFSPGNPVFVQCFTLEDRAFIERVGAPFVPVSLGPADWVDAEVFEQPASRDKRFDLVMVANWGRHKRHSILFQALQGLRDRDTRVLLVGFPWAGRSADDVRREASLWPNPRVTFEIVENIPHVELARLLAQCRVFVFLSKKEGDNKALVEAMFADVPVIVYDRSVGGAASRVNAETGVFSSDRELADKIRYMLDHHAEFSPRRWALEHTGSGVATKALDGALRGATLSSGGAYSTGIVEKTNAPNLAYKHQSDRARFQQDYDFIVSCRR